LKKISFLKYFPSPPHTPVIFLFVDVRVGERIPNLFAFLILLYTAFSSLFNLLNSSLVFNSKSEVPFLDNFLLLINKDMELLWIG